MHMKKRAKKGIARLWVLIAILIAIIIAVVVSFLGMSTAVMYGPMPR